MAMVRVAGVAAVLTMFFGAGAATKVARSPSIWVNTPVRMTRVSSDSFPKIDVTAAVEVRHGHYSLNTGLSDVAFCGWDAH